jgi:hypothetical protein
MNIPILLASLAALSMTVAHAQNFGNLGNINANTNNSVIVSGQTNAIASGATGAFIGAGLSNTVSSNTIGAFIGSGQNNLIVARASFEAVGMAVAGRGTLVGSGAQMPVALDEHGVVNQERDGLG